MIQATTKLISSVFLSFLLLLGLSEVVLAASKTWNFDQSSDYGLIGNSSIEDGFVKGVVAQTNLNLEQVGSWGDLYGGVSDIAVQGRYMYLAMSRRGVAIMDVNAPSSPVFVGMLRPKLGDSSEFWEINTLDIKGNYLYAGAGEEFVIFDVSTPSSPVVTGSINTPVWGQLDIQIIGSRAFVIGSTSLTVIDISNPESPSVETTLNGIDVPNNNLAHVIEVRDSYAYIVGKNSLYVVDISATASIVATLNMSSNTTRGGISLSGDYAYIASDSGLTVVNIGNPLSPSVTSTLGSDSNGSNLSPFGLDIIGSYAYLAEFGNGIKVVDISDPSSPSVIHTLDTVWVSGGSKRGAYGIYVANNVAYVSNGWRGLQILDVNAPAAPSILSTVDTSGDSHDIAVSGDYAFVAEDSRGLQVLDITDIQEPVKVATLAISPKEITIEGHYAYITTFSAELVVIDISDPLYPALVSSTSIAARYGLTSTGGYVYVGTEAGFSIIDVTNPLAPQLVKAVPLSGGVSDISLFGDYAYVASSNKLSIIDISDPLTASVVSQLSVNANKVAVDGGYAYVSSTWGFDIQVVDVSDPLSPVLGASVSNPNSFNEVRAIQADAQYVYVLGAEGFQVINAENKNNPQFVESLTLSYVAEPGINGSDIVLADNHAFIVRGYDGMQVIKLSEPLVSVKPKVTFDYTEALTAFSPALGSNNQSSMRYKLINNEITYYHNGQTWAVSSTENQTNTAEEINQHIGSFHETAGFGSFSFKVYFSGTSGDVVELNSVSVSTEDSQTTANLNNGLVAHYEFDGEANDSSSNGNHGVAQNGVVFSAGLVNQSAIFSDTKEIRIEVPDSNSLDTHDSFSLSIWVYPSDRRSSVLVQKYFSSEQWAGGEYSLGLSEEGNVKLSIANYDSTGVTDSIQMESSIPLSQWSYVTASFDKGEMKLFINGNIVQEKVSPIKQITTKEYSHDGIHIGNIVYNNYNDGWFVGKIDELRIYNRALNTVEIEELYQISLALPTRTITEGTVHLSGVYNENIILEGGTIIIDDATTINGYVTQKGGSIDLNGQIFEVKEAFLQSAGSVNVNGGSLTVNGDYRLQTLQEDGSYTHSTANLYMTNVADHVLVLGDFVMDSSNSHSGNLSKGVLEIKGDFTQQSSASNSSAAYTFSASGTHQVILSGDAKQQVHFDDPNSSHFHILELSNSSTEGVEFATKVITAGELITHSTALTFAGGDLNVQSWVLQEDLSFEQDMAFSGGSIDLNGYTLTITGNLNVSGMRVLLNGGALNVAEDLTVTSGSLDLKEGELSVGKTLLQSAGSVNVNGGSLTVNGDYRLQTLQEDGSYTHSTANLYMTNVADHVLVLGDFVMDSSNSHSGNLSKGVLEIKGDFTQQSSASNSSAAYTFSASGTHQVILSGDAKQQVHFDDPNSSYFHILELSNSSAGGVEFLSSFNATQVLIANNLPIIFAEGILSSMTWVLQGDLSIDQDMVFSGITFELNGHTVDINGSLNISNDIWVSDGALNITEDFVVDRQFNFYEGELNIGGTLISNDTLNIRGTAIAVDGDHFANSSSITLADASSLIINGEYHMQIREPIVGFTFGNPSLSLSGQSEVVCGDFLQSAGAVKLGGGSLTTNGDYRLQKLKEGGGYTYSTGELYMTNVTDNVLVLGDFVIDTLHTGSRRSYNNDFNNGVLEIKGNFTQLSSDNYYSFEGESFMPYGEHKVVLSGDAKQQVYFDDPSDSHFSTLVLNNSSTEGVDFSSAVIVTKLFNHELMHFNLSDEANSTFSDYDSDGTKDHQDSYPLDETRQKPSAPTITNSLPLQSGDELFAIELKGEGNNSVLVNDIDVGKVTESGDKTIVLNLGAESGSKVFNIRLKDTIGNESDALVLSIEKEDDVDNVPSELSVPSVEGEATGDGNGDGTPDSVQESVTSLQTESGGGWLTFANTTNKVQANFVTAATASIDVPEGTQLTTGVVTFDLEVTVGEEVTIELFVEKNLAIKDYYLLGNDGEWYAQNAVITHIGNKTKIVFSVTQGGNFDRSAKLAGRALLSKPGGSDTTTILSLAEGGVMVTTGFDVAPSTYLYGQTDLYTQTPSKDFVLSNTGSRLLAIVEIEITGKHASDYLVQADGCQGQVLAEGETCTISVSFQPSVVGSRTALLSLTTDDPDNSAMSVFLHNHESDKEESARRLPPVLNELSIKNGEGVVVDSMQPNTEYTVEWSILGYHTGYISSVAMFNCSTVTNNTCGANYSDSTRFLSSGRVDPSSTGNGEWSYAGEVSQVQTFSHTFTTPDYTTSTPIVIRFYRLNTTDLAVGNGGLSLIIPGNHAENYYDSTGRRVMSIIAP